MSSEIQTTPEKQANIRPGKNGVVPPVAYRWKPGQSANPGGRPAGESLTAVLREALSVEKKAGKNKGLSNSQIIVEALITAATEKNVGAIKEILDRIDGPVKQKIELEQVAHGVREQALKDFAAYSQISANIHDRYCSGELLQEFARFAGIDEGVVIGFLEQHGGAVCMCLSQEQIASSILAGFAPSQQAIALAAIDEVEG